MQEAAGLRDVTLTMFLVSQPGNVEFTNNYRRDPAKERFGRSPLGRASFTVSVRPANSFSANPLIAALPSFVLDSHKGKAAGVSGGSVCDEISISHGSKFRE
jgi:hypothetical protein